VRTPSFFRLEANLAYAEIRQQGDESVGAQGIDAA
jgi:hypothetical protein